MNLADIPQAADLAARLAQLVQIRTEGPTAATIHVTTPGGNYDITMTPNEMLLGLSQITNEVKQGLMALGVQVP